MLAMKKKKLTMLVLGSMITAAGGEDFINAEKELGRFTSPFDFGTPVQTESAVAAEKTSPEEAGDTNETVQSETVEKHRPKQELRKELNISCGAKCGISFKNEDNDS